MGGSKEETARRFGRLSRGYLESPAHAQGKDLEMLVSILDPADTMTVLDVATGAGHTACALARRVARVTAVDLAPEMIERVHELAQSKGITNLDALVMDAEELKFAPASFDVVTSRIAAHHFPDIKRALAEMVRVLKPGGLIVIEDSMAPADSELDTFINDLERLRDPTHVRSYTKRQWQDMVLAAGLSLDKSEIFRKRHDIKEWLDHQGLDERARQPVFQAFWLAPKAAREYFEILYDGQIALAYTDDKLILRALKPS